MKPIRALRSALLIPLAVVLAAGSPAEAAVIDYGHVGTLTHVEQVHVYVVAITGEAVREPLGLNYGESIVAASCQFVVLATPGSTLTSCYVHDATANRNHWMPAVAPGVGGELVEVRAGTTSIPTNHDLYLCGKVIVDGYTVEDCELFLLS